MSGMNSMEQAIASIGKKANLVKWGVGIGAVILFGFIGAFLVQGLVSGIFLLLLILGITEFGPVLGMKFKNAKIAAIKAEARKTPVETLQVQYQEKEQRLNVTKEKIFKFATKVKNYEMQVKDFVVRFPSDAMMFQDTLAAMQALLDRRRTKWQESRKNLEDFGSVIVKADAFWQMALATAEIKEAAGQMEDNFIERLKKETALSSVQEALASSLADLDQMMMEEIDIKTPSSSPTAIEHQPSNVIDIQAKVVSSVPVNRS